MPMTYSTVKQYAHYSQPELVCSSEVENPFHPASQSIHYIISWIAMQTPILYLNEFLISSKNTFAYPHFAPSAPSTPSMLFCYFKFLCHLCAQTQSSTSRRPCILPVHRHVRTPSCSLIIDFIPNSLVSYNMLCYTYIYLPRAPDT